MVSGIGAVFALSALLALLVVFAVAEDIPGGGWSGANIRPASFDELERAYLALPDPPEVGGVNRNSYFIWGLANLLYDSFSEDQAKQLPPCIELQDFKDKYCKGLDAMVANLAQADKDIPGVTDIVLSAAFLMHSHSVSAERNWVPAEEHAAEIIDYYTTGEGKDRMQKACFRQAMSILANRRLSSAYTDCTNKMGGRGLFLLGRMDAPPVAAKPQYGTREFVEYAATPIPGLPVSPDRKPRGGKYDCLMHPFVKIMDKGAGAYFVFGGSDPNLYITTWGGGPTSPRHYFESFVFQRGFFRSDCIPKRNPSEGNPLNGFFHDLGNRIVADIRSVRISGEFWTSMDIRKLCDPSEQCYSRVMEMAVVNDHPEFATGLEALDALAKYSPKELFKYDAYLRESEAFLVADYERTVITTIHTHAFLNGLKGATMYASPDFTTVPKIWVVFIPRIWLRYGAVYGLESLLFDMNLLGIGDRENLIKGDGKK